MPENIVQSLEQMQNDLHEVRSAISSVIVGHTELIEHLLISVACGGHVLLEGVPGLGKTLLVRTLAKVLNLSYTRIQFTPDLMPADILGANILVRDETGERTFRFQPGPIFAQIVLADEINRTSPKTQAALLEAMQERRVTIGGREHPLPEPFFVLATQNPIEMEGTYPLPEAQVDRFFFKLKVLPPNMDELRLIVERTTGTEMPVPQPVWDSDRVSRLQDLVRAVPAATVVRDYALRLVMATHPDQPEAPEPVKQYVRYGASPRGAQALLLAAKARALFHGRYNASLEDVQAVTLPALRHRLILNFAAEADGVDSDALLQSILASLPREVAAS